MGGGAGAANGFFGGGGVAWAPSALPRRRCLWRRGDVFSFLSSDSFPLPSSAGYIVASQIGGIEESTNGRSLSYLFSCLPQLSPHIVQEGGERGPDKFRRNKISAVSGERLFLAATMKVNDTDTLNFTLEFCYKLFLSSCCCWRPWPPPPSGGTPTTTSPPTSRWSSGKRTGGSGEKHLCDVHFKLEQAI